MFLIFLLIPEFIVVCLLIPQQIYNSVQHHGLHYGQSAILHDVHDER